VPAHPRRPRTQARGYLLSALVLWLLATARTALAGPLPVEIEHALRLHQVDPADLTRMFHKGAASPST